MRTLLSILLSVLLLSGSACDFPADPPLKSATPDPPPGGTDPEHVLLPLKEGNSWVYLPNQKNRPPESPRITSAIPIAYDTLQLYEVRYIFQQGPQAPKILAFPPLLRNTGEGLAFYDKVFDDDTLILRQPPVHRFTLPYPAETGAVWLNASGTVRVKLVTTDTLVGNFNGNFTWRVHRYDVFVHQSPTVSFFVLPGTALIRTEDRNLSFETVSWRLF